MATPVNPQYQLELFQEFERHLPAQWFKKLYRQEGVFYPLVWGLCGALAGVRESIEAARSQAIPLESEGFWLSLHLLGLGLTRRGGETDAQGKTRYQFEFSPTRNTRAGLLRAIAAHSGLEVPSIRLETNFSQGALGEINLVIETEDDWFTVPWWWLRPFFDEWVANGLSTKANLTTNGLRTLAFPAWDFYTRFPTGPELLAPFWERPAFINDLRLINSTRQLEQRSLVFGLEGGWLFEGGQAYTLPNADTYSLGTFTSPIPLVPSALSDISVSRNVLAFIDIDNWDDYSLRIKEIWQALSSAQQPGQPLLYLGDNADYLLVETITLPTPAFPDDEPLEILGYGPWQLFVDGQPLILAGQWWTDADAIARLPVPQIDGSSNAYLMLEFILSKTEEPRQINTLDLVLGYKQPEYNATLGWSLADADSWLLPSANLWQVQAGDAPEALNLNLPVRSQIYERTVNITVPGGVNMGFLLLLEVPT